MTLDILAAVVSGALALVTIGIGFWFLFARYNLIDLAFGKGLVSIVVGSVMTFGSFGFLVKGMYIESILFSVVILAVAIPLKRWMKAGQPK